MRHPNGRRILPATMHRRHRLPRVGEIQLVWKKVRGQVKHSATKVRLAHVLEARQPIGGASGNAPPVPHSLHEWFDRSQLFHLQDAPSQQDTAVPQRIYI